MCDRNFRISGEEIAKTVVVAAQSAQLATFARPDHDSRTSAPPLRFSPRLSTSTMVNHIMAKTLMQQLCHKTTILTVVSAWRILGLINYQHCCVRSVR